MAPGTMNGPRVLYDQPLFGRRKEVAPSQVTPELPEDQLGQSMPASVKPARQSLIPAGMFKTAPQAKPVSVDDEGWTDTAANLGLSMAAGGGDAMAAMGGLLEMAYPDSGAVLRRQGTSLAQAMEDKLDPAYKEAIRKEWATLGPNAAYSDWRAWSAGISRQIPNIAALVGVGAGAATLGAPAAVAGGVVAGAGAALTAGQASSGVGTELEKMDPKSIPEVQRLVKGGMPEADALRQVTTTAQRTAGAIAAPAGAVGGIAVNRLAGRVAGQLAAKGVAGQATAQVGKQGVVSRVGGNVATGVLAEGAEEGGAAFGQEVGRTRAGLEMRPGQVLESTVAGAAMGGAIGGGAPTAVSLTGAAGRVAGPVVNKSVNLLSGGRLGKPAPAVVKPPSAPPPAPVQAPAGAGVLTTPPPSPMLQPQALPPGRFDQYEKLADTERRLTNRLAIKDGAPTTVSRNRDKWLDRLQAVRREKSSIEGSFDDPRLPGAELTRREGAKAALSNIDDELTRTRASLETSRKRAAKTGTATSKSVSASQAKMEARVKDLEEARGRISAESPLVAVPTEMEPARSQQFSPKGQALPQPSQQPLRTVQPQAPAPGVAPESRQIAPAPEQPMAQRLARPGATVEDQLISLTTQMDDVQQQMQVERNRGRQVKLTARFKGLVQAKQSLESQRDSMSEAKRRVDQLPNQMDMFGGQGAIEKGRSVGMVAPAEATAFTPEEFAQTPIGAAINTSQMRSTRSAKGWAARRARRAEQMQPKLAADLREIGAAPPVDPPSQAPQAQAGAMAEVAAVTLRNSSVTSGPVGARRDAGGQPRRTGATQADIGTPDMTVPTTEQSTPTPSPAPAPAKIETDAVTLELEAEPSPIMSGLQEQLEAGDLINVDQALAWLSDRSPSSVRPLLGKLSSLGMQVEIVAEDASELPQGADALYDPGTDTITINKTLVGSEPGLIIALTHELVHAATLASYRSNPAVRRELDSLAMTVFDRMVENGLAPENLPYLANGAELTAGILSDPAFADYVDTLNSRAKGGSFYRRFKEVLGTMLGARSKVQKSYVDQVVDLANRSMLDEGSRQRLMESLRDKGEVEAASLLFLPQLTAILHKNSPGTLDNLDEAARSGRAGLLYAMTQQHITDRNARFFEDPGNPNLLRQHFGLTQKRDAETRVRLVRYEQTIERWQAFAAADMKANNELSDFMLESTYAAIHPDRASTDPSNAFGVGKPAGMQKHAALGARWNALPQEAKAIYIEVRNRFEQDWDETVTQLITARLAAAGYANAATLAPQLTTKQAIQASTLPKNVKEQLKVAVELRQAQGPYFPSKRFGKYFTVAYSPEQVNVTVSATKMLALDNDHEIVVRNYSELANGNYEVTYQRKVVENYESFREATRQSKTLRGFSTVEVRTREELTQDLQGVMPQTVTKLVEEITAVNPAAADAVRSFFLERVPDTSVKKASLKRAKVAGASRDMLRSFATYGRANAYYMAQLGTGRDIQTTIAEMDKFARSVTATGDFDRGAWLTTIANHIKGHDQILRDNAKRMWSGGSGVMDNLPQIAAFWFLTGFGSILTNATQIVTFTAPTLGARYGNAKTAVAMVRAMKRMGPAALKETGQQYVRAKKGFKLRRGYRPPIRDPSKSFFEHATSRMTPDEQQIVKEMADLNRIDFGQVADIRALANGRQGSFLSWIADIGFIAPQAVEASNRIITAVATYNLAKDAGMSNPTELREHVAEMLDKTQFLYSQSNKPSLFMASDLAKPFLVFKTYPLHVYQLVTSYFMDAARIAKQDGWKAGANSLEFRTGLGITVATAMFSGLAGALFEPLTVAWRMIARARGVDIDMEQAAVFNAVGDTIGLDGDILRKGPVATLLGIDLDRLGMSRMLVPEFNGTEPRDLFATLGELAFGAPGGIAKGVYEGIGKFIEGDIMGGLESAAPKAFGLNDAIRAHNLSQKGVVDANGYVTLAPDQLAGGDVIRRMLGFTPLDVSTAQELRRTKNSLKYDNREERSELMRRFAQGRTAGEDVAEVLSDIRDYNKAHPTAPITRSTLLRSMKNRQRTQSHIDEYGVAATRQDMPILEEVDEAYGVERE